MIEEIFKTIIGFLYLEKPTDLKNYYRVFITILLSYLIVITSHLFISFYANFSWGENFILPSSKALEIAKALLWLIPFFLVLLHFINLHQINKAKSSILDPNKIIEKIDEISKKIIDDRKVTHAKLREFIIQLTNLNFLKSYDLFKNILENGVISTETSQVDHFKKFLDFSGKFKLICNIPDKELKNINDKHGATLLCVVSNENYFDKPEDVIKLLRYFIKNRQQFQDEVQRIFSIPGVRNGEIIKYNSDKIKAINLYKLLKINEILGFRTFLQIYDPSAPASDLKFIKGADYVLYIPFDHEGFKQKSELFLSHEADKVVATDDAFIIEFARNDYYHRRNGSKNVKHFIELLNSESDGIIRQRLSLSQDEADNALIELREIAKKLQENDADVMNELESLSPAEIEISKKFDSIKTRKNKKVIKV